MRPSATWLLTENDPWSGLGRLARVTGIERTAGLGYRFALSDETEIVLGPEDSLPVVLLREATHLNPAIADRVPVAAGNVVASETPVPIAGDAPAEDDSPEDLLRRAYDFSSLGRARQLEGIAAADTLARDVHRRLAELVLGARADRTSWDEIGGRLGITGDEAYRRFSPDLRRYNDPGLADPDGS